RAGDARAGPRAGAEASQGAARGGRRLRDEGAGPRRRDPTQAARALSGPLGGGAADVGHHAARAEARPRMITHEQEGTRAWPVVAGELRRVLDVGCGNGDALARAGTDFLAVGLDIDRDAPRMAPGRVYRPRHRPGT